VNELSQSNQHDEAERESAQSDFGSMRYNINESQRARDPYALSTAIADIDPYVSDLSETQIQHETYLAVEALAHFCDAYSGKSGLRQKDRSFPASLRLPTTSSAQWSNYFNNKVLTSPYVQAVLQRCKQPDGSFDLRDEPLEPLLAALLWGLHLQKAPIPEQLYALVRPQWRPQGELGSQLGQLPKLHATWAMAAATSIHGFSVPQYLPHIDREQQLSYLRTNAYVTMLVEKWNALNVEARDALAPSKAEETDEHATVKLEQARRKFFNTFLFSQELRDQSSERARNSSSAELTEQPSERPSEYDYLNNFVTRANLALSQTRIAQIEGIDDLFDGKIPSAIAESYYVYLMDLTKEILYGITADRAIKHQQKAQREMRSDALRRGLRVLQRLPELKPNHVRFLPSTTIAPNSDASVIGWTVKPTNKIAAIFRRRQECYFIVSSKTNPNERIAYRQVTMNGKVYSLKDFDVVRDRNGRLEIRPARDSIIKPSVAIDTPVEKKRSTTERIGHGAASKIAPDTGKSNADQQSSKRVRFSEHSMMLKAFKSLPSIEPALGEWKRQSLTKLPPTSRGEIVGKRRDDVVLKFTHRKIPTVSEYRVMPIAFLAQFCVSKRDVQVGTKLTFAQKDASVSRHGKIYVVGWERPERGKGKAAVTRSAPSLSL
jgi:hypothetical protein